VLPEVVALQRRVKALEQNQEILTTALQGTTQCMELAKLIADIGRVMQGLKPA